VQTQYFLGQTYYALGDYRQAMEVVRRNIAAIGDELHHERFGLPTLAAVASRAVLVKCLTATGAFPEGINRGAEAVRIAEAYNHAHSCFLAYFRVGSLYLQQGDLQQAIPRLERGLAYWQAFSLQPWFPPIASALGYARVLAGHIAEAIPLLDQAFAQVTSRRTMFEPGLSLAWLSEALLLTGRIHEAITLARRALEYACAHKERGDEALALRLLGEITVYGDPLAVTEAETYYSRALGLAQELSMRPLQAHCHRGLGSLYGKKGRQEQAHAAISTALELYGAMKMTFWLPQAEAVLAQVAGR
jgi:tetratricopeptide (TPR) repeat protein